MAGCRCSIAPHCAHAIATLSGMASMTVSEFDRLAEDPLNLQHPATRSRRFGSVRPYVRGQAALGSV